MTEFHAPFDPRFPDALVSQQRRIAYRVILSDGFHSVSSHLSHAYTQETCPSPSLKGKFERIKLSHRSQDAFNRLFLTPDWDDSIFTENPNGSHVRDSLDQVFENVCNLSATRAFYLDIEEAEKIAKNAVNFMSIFKHSMAEIATLYASVGMSPAEQKKLIKMLKVSIPAMIIINGIVGAGSEFLAAYLGINHYRNEILHYLDGVDPVLRNMFAVLGPLFSQSLLFLLTDMRNKLSIEMGENGLIPFDPAQYAVYKLTGSDKKQNGWKQIAKRIGTHIAYPGNWPDFKWFGMLLAGDYGVTFTGGVIFAILAKLIYLIGGKSAIKLKQNMDKRRRLNENGEEQPQEELAEIIKNDLLPDIIRWLSTKSEEELSELLDLTKIPGLHAQEFAM